MVRAVTINSRNVINMLNGISRKFATKMDKGIGSFTKRLADQIRLEARARNHIASGFLSSERGTFARRIKQGIWEIKMPFYREFLERGTLPHFIPRTPKLVRWAEKRGIPFIALKKSIARKGTQAHPFTQFVINRELRRLRDTVTKPVNRLIRNKGRG